MLGGTMGPMVEEAAVMAAVNSSSYPPSLIIWTSTIPRPPASARAEPDMPEKIMLAKNVDMGQPPTNMPHEILAKRDDPVGDFPPLHEIRGQDEQGDGGQDETVRG